MTFHYRYRKQILIGIILMILIIGIIMIFIKTHPKKKEKEPEVIIKKEKKEEKIESPEELYKVDIKGEIQAPGIYTLNASSRVIDVIEAAGGLTENADTSVINLSKKISDEMVIIIYSREQVYSFEETKKIEEQVQKQCITPDENSIKNDACIMNTQNSNGKININTATINELTSLSGIGAAKAKEIIKYREQSPFQSIEEIKNISGIGDNIFDQIKENITV